MSLSTRRFAELIADAENGVAWSPEDALLVAGYLQRTISIASMRRDQLRGTHRALKNMNTRALAHHEAEKTIAAYRSGTRTALQWVDGTHPRLLAGHP